MPVERTLSRPGRVERVLALRAFPGLSKVDPGLLAPLADIASERVFEAGVTIIAEASEARSFHLVRSGTIGLQRKQGMRREFGPGDVVGAVRALARRPDDAQAVALSRVRTFEVDRDEFEDLLEESIVLLLTVLRELMHGVLTSRARLPDDAGFSSPIVGEGGREGVDLGLVERVVFLRRLMTYGRARVEALADLARHMTELRVPAGTELFDVGAPAPYALLVWSGVIACETANGQRFRLGPESVVGGIDSIANVPRWYRAVAETDVVALQSDVSHLIDVIEDNPDLGLDMLRAGARILSDLLALEDAHP